jgi:hypothetical protein
VPHIVKSTILDAPTGAVWNVLRDFNGHDRWHPAVATSARMCLMKRSRQQPRQTFGDGPAPRKEVHGSTAIFQPFRPFGYLKERPFG